MTRRFGSRGARYGVIAKTAMATAALALMASHPALAKEFRYSTGQDVLGLDPYINNHGGTNAMKGNIYGTLVYRDAELKLHPDLATEWTQVSPTQWTFKLRQGVKFHNGEDFNADDVIFSWKRSIQPASQMQYTVATIKNMTKVDDYTLSFELNGPDPVLLQNLSQFFIMDEGWTKSNGAEQVVAGANVTTFSNLNANGTGPFRIVERVPDTRTVVEPNPNWHGTPTHNLTRATFMPIGNVATRVSALLSGDIDLMYHVPPQDIQRLEGAPGVRVMPGGTVRVIFFGFDHFRDELLDMPGTGKNPFKDIRVRQAVYHAIDVAGIRRAVMRNSSSPQGLMIAQGVTGFQPDLNERLAFDPAKARELLAQAGYPNGFPLTLHCPNNRYYNDEAICAAVIPMLTRVGIQARLVAQPMTQHVNTAGPTGPNGGYSSSMYMLGWTPGNMDISNPLQELLAFEPDRRRGLANNWGRYNNPALNALTDQIIVETDSEKRNQLSRQAMEIVKNDIAYVPIHQEPQVFGIRDTVAEFTMRRNEDVDLRYVRMK